MQRPPLLEADEFCFWKTHFKTYIKAKDIDLWQVIQNGNSQVKDCKIDLLTQKYEKFLISDEETIDSGFTGFNAIVTCLKSLDKDYPNKSHVRKFLRALPLRWQPKVTAIEEAKDWQNFLLMS
nr:UBN2 domain-containing protein [Tanacetum cinerariifolium]